MRPAVGGARHDVGVEVAEHIDALAREGGLLAAAAERAGLAAPVPSCPPWQVSDLLRHIGYVHRWAAGFVAGQPLPGDPGEDEVLRAGPPDAELPGWFRAGHAALVTALRAADPALECWAPVPGPSSRAAWARRQAHETAIHRVDAELAAGPVTPFPADFAADGIDELIMGFLARQPEAPGPGPLAGPQPAVQVAATDSSPAAWLVEVADGSRTARVRRGAGHAACTLSGPASGLYQLLWNRCDPASAGVTVGGDASLAQSWRESTRIRWS
jgi:uncharacterized protein (TIGR03083 family)